MEITAPYNILLSANREDEEPWRITRLNQCIGCIRGMEGITTDTGKRQPVTGDPIPSSVLAKVAKLHDHKGTLTVTWHTPPALEEGKMFNAVWGTGDIGDGNESGVEHKSLYENAEGCSYGRLPAGL